MENALAILKILVLVSILFVWFVRYDNIVKEFKEYGYPNWLRDFVGILKISFAILIQNDNTQIMQIGCIGLAALMSAAVFTHIKMKNKPGQALPSVSLLTIAIVLLVLS